MTSGHKLTFDVGPLGCHRTSEANAEFLGNSQHDFIGFQRRVSYYLRGHRPLGLTMEGVACMSRSLEVSWHHEVLCRMPPRGPAPSLEVL